MANPRIAQIFRIARQKLGDADMDRWSDPDLLDLLDLGHKDLARHAKFLRGEVVIPVIVGKSKYQLPPDVYTILRAEYQDKVLELTSYEAMDAAARDQLVKARPSVGAGGPKTLAWMGEEGPDPVALIYDKHNLCEVRVYPIPSTPSDVVQYSFANESGIQLPFAGAELFGVTTQLDDYTFDSPYGVVTDMHDPYFSTTLEDEEGVVTSIYETEGSITIRYIKVPDTLTSTSSDLLSHGAYDTALMHYVVGNALLNDLDERNSARGQAELVMYQRELDNAILDAQKHGTRKSSRPAQYRGGFE